MSALASTADADSPVVLLLAAGESRRFDGIKQLADIDGQPMLRRAARVALETMLPVIVVLGAHADAVSPTLSDLPLLQVRHDAWHEGMGSSLAAGMRHLQSHFPEASAVLLLLGDQPLVHAAALGRLLAQHRSTPRQIIATADTAGPAGPPVLFPRDCFDALLACHGPQGARAVLSAEASRVVLQSGGDPLDVDTREDLRRVREALARRH